MKRILLLTMAAVSMSACGYVNQTNEYVVTSTKPCCTTTTKYVTKTCCPTVVKKPVVNQCCNSAPVMTSGCCGNSYYPEPAVYTDTYVGDSIYATDYDYYY